MKRPYNLNQGGMNKSKAMMWDHQVKKRHQGDLEGSLEINTLPMISEWRFLNLKASWMQKNSWIGFILWKEFLNTKMFQMTRESSLWHSDYVSMLPYGGLTCVLNELEKERLKFELGIK